MSYHFGYAKAYTMLTRVEFFLTRSKLRKPLREVRGLTQVRVLLTPNALWQGPYWKCKGRFLERLNCQLAAADKHPCRCLYGHQLAEPTPATACRCSQPSQPKTSASQATSSWTFAAMSAFNQPLSTPCSGPKSVKILFDLLACTWTAEAIRSKRFHSFLHLPLTFQDPVTATQVWASVTESVRQVALIPLRIVNLMIPAETVHWTNGTFLGNLCPPNKTISAGACQTMIDQLENTQQKLSASIAVSVTQLRPKRTTNRNGPKHIVSQRKWNKQIQRTDTLLTGRSRSFPPFSNRIEELAACVLNGGNCLHISPASQQLHADGPWTPWKQHIPWKHPLVSLAAGTADCTGEILPRQTMEVYEKGSGSFCLCRSWDTLRPVCL